MQSGEIPHAASFSTPSSGIAFSEVSCGTISNPSRQFSRKVASYGPQYVFRSSRVRRMKSRSKSVYIIVLSSLELGCSAPRLRTSKFFIQPLAQLSYQSLQVADRHAL